MAACMVWRCCERVKGVSVLWEGVAGQYCRRMKVETEVSEAVERCVVRRCCGSLWCRRCCGRVCV